MGKTRNTGILTDAISLDSNKNVTLANGLTVTTVANMAGTASRFLVVENGVFQYRTAGQILSDIGALSTEVDPVFTASAAYGITATNISNWNTAYGWGNHANAGYVPYTGATGAVDLGSNNLTTTGFVRGSTFTNAANPAISGNLVIQPANNTAVIVYSETNQTQIFTVQSTTGVPVFSVNTVVNGINITGTGIFSSTVRAAGILVNTTSHFTAGGTAVNTIYASGPSTFGLSSTDAVYLRRLGVGEYQFQTVAEGASAGVLSLQTYGGGVAIGTTTTSDRAIYVLHNTASTYAATIQQNNPAGLGLQIYANLTAWGADPFTISSNSGNIVSINPSGAAYFAGGVGIGMADVAVTNYNSINIAGTTGTFYRAYTGVTETFRVQTSSTLQYILALKGGFRFDTESLSSAFVLSTAGAATFASGLSVNNAVHQTLLGAGLTIEGVTYSNLYFTNSNVLTGYMTSYSGGIIINTSVGNLILNNGTGSVLVGTTSSSGYKFEVTGDAAFNNDLYVWGKYASTVRADSGVNVNSATGVYWYTDVTASGALAGIGHVNNGLRFLSGGSGTMTEKVRLTAGGSLIVGTTNTDIGGTVEGINLSENKYIQASNSLTGALSYIYYGDRRGTNNAGPVYMLALNGYMKASIGFVGSSSTHNDGGITFNTISGNTTSVERVRVDVKGLSTYNGTYFNKTTGHGGFNILGTIAATDSADRYLHVRIDTVSGMMVWFKVFGYSYTAGMIEGMCAGYIYGSTGALFNNYNTGSIVASYFNTATNYTEIVIDMISTATTNRFGSVSILGGSDNITTILPLSIVDYSWTSTTARVY